ncbi:MAG: DivIVA domain-containing protein [Hymenobacteraceae bacterium]|nr:DivIVA domain-containing protein [Hymenobacteraceae bacterium]
MRITPIEIRQKTFEKSFRGIDKDEVQAFLTTLSQEWDKLMEENRQQKIALERAESQVAKLREVETGLYHTLKTAQDTSQSMTQQAQQDAQTVRGKAEQEASLARTTAQQEADKTVKTAQQEADKLLADARTTAKKLVEDAQRETERVTGALQTRFADLEREHRQLQGHFDKLLADLRAAATTALDRADSAQAIRTKAAPAPTLAAVAKASSPPAVAPVSGNPPAAAANKEAAPAPRKPADLPMPAVLISPPVAGGPHPGMPEIAPIQPSVMPTPSAPPVERPEPEITPQRQPQPMQPEPLPPSPPAPAQPSPITVPQPMNNPAPKPTAGGSFFDEI